MVGLFRLIQKRQPSKAYLPRPSSHSTAEEFSCYPKQSPSVASGQLSKECPS
jgi:hypothetical protein